MDHENAASYGSSAKPTIGKGGRANEGARGHGDLVGDVIRESGCCCEQVDQAQRRAAGESFSQALVDEGLAARWASRGRSPRTPPAAQSTSPSPASTPRR